MNIIKKTLQTAVTLTISLATVTLNLPPINAQQINPLTSANGKYGRLTQILNCPQDRNTYADFNDYGYWGGGEWCGKMGKAGYWVWVTPNWYVWEIELNSMSSVNGKYTNLLQVLKCEGDRGSYGEFNEYGYWGGGEWCGQTGKPGYWVWSAPNWYVWQNKR